MSQDLKPCPFCGEPPKTMARPNNADSTQFFACVVCYCDGHSATAHKSASRPTQGEAEAAARDAWNTRAQAPAAAPRELDAWKCVNCCGAGWTWQLRQVAERATDVQQVKIHCDECGGTGWCGPDAEKAAKEQP